MSDNDRNEAREAAARAFTGLCCVTVADEVCEDCVGALLYLASMHEAIEYLHLRDFAQQNTIRNLRRRPSRHEAHEDVVERMRVTARDLLHDMETTDVTIAIQEREEARDQTRGLLAALEQAQAEAAVAGRAIGAYAVAQEEAAHLRRALEWLNECNIGCVHPAGECYDLPHPGDSAPDCRPCRMALATAAAHGRDLRAFWHEWTRNGENTEAALVATEEVTR